MHNFKNMYHNFSNCYLIFSDPKQIALKKHFFEVEDAAIQINNKLYKKCRGRAYRTYYICIKKNCGGQVMVNDLQGGIINEVQPHVASCLHQLP